MRIGTSQAGRRSTSPQNNAGGSFSQLSRVPPLPPQPLCPAAGGDCTRRNPKVSYSRYSLSLKKKGEKERKEKGKKGKRKEKKKERKEKRKKEGK